MEKISGSVCWLASLVLVSAVGCGAEPNGIQATEGTIGTKEQALTTQILPKFGGPLGTWAPSPETRFYAYGAYAGAYVDYLCLAYLDSGTGYGTWCQGGEGGTWSGWRVCNGSDWISGYYGRSGSWIDQIGFTCRNSSGTDYTLAPVGGTGGDPFSTVSCWSGYNLRKFYMWTGAYVDATQGFCMDY